MIGLLTAASSFICVIGALIFVTSSMASQLAADQDLENKRQQAEQRLKREAARNQKTCHYVVAGMTKYEVRDIMGIPDYEGLYSLKYGKKDIIEVWFNDAGGVTRVENCKRP